MTSRKTVHAATLTLAPLLRDDFLNPRCSRRSSPLRSPLRRGIDIGGVRERETPEREKEKEKTHFFVFPALGNFFFFSTLPPPPKPNQPSGALYKNVIRIQRQITFNQVKGIFGFGDSTNIGMVSFPAVQAAPALPDTFPHIFGENQKGVRCLVPCAIDQDPYFRMTRDICQKLGHIKTAVIEARFFPALQGESGKMSASDPNSAIFVTDTPKQIKTKINKHAFSGGKATIEEHRALGADLSVDIPWKWLQFFLDDDEELQKIGEEYGSGRMLTGEIKARLSELLSELVGGFQERRAKVDDARVKEFTCVRDMTGLLEGKVFVKGPKSGKKSGSKSGGGGGGGGGDANEKKKERKTEEKEAAAAAVEEKKE